MTKKVTKNTNFNLNKMNLNEHISDDFSHLETILSEEKKAVPSEYLDKQIIAAGYRKKPISNPAENYRKGWWNRLSLPLYVLTGFTFTVFAFNSLWPKSIVFSSDSEQHSTSIEVKVEEPDNSNSVPESQLIKRDLPTFIEPPKYIKRSSSGDIATAIELDEKNQQESQTNPEQIYTGTLLSKAKYPEQDAWARKIIEMVKNGENEKVRIELTRFKKVYPNFPIEEQIKALTN